MERVKQLFAGMRARDVAFMGGYALYLAFGYMSFESPTVLTSLGEAGHLVQSVFLIAVIVARFAVYGTKGVFIKQTEDQQEHDLKHFYLLGSDHPDFGVDTPDQYGTLTYVADDGSYHEEKVVSEVGDYSRVYEAVYQSLVHGAPKLVKDEETLAQLQILETGFQQLREE